jgi:hypothetical protein
MSSGDVETIALHWRPLVASVRSGELEGVIGGCPFMYVEPRNAFVSDPQLLEDIHHARARRGPFLLVGPMGTGKNLFIELVARGDTGGPSQPCLDENVDGHVDEWRMIEHFFGPSGIVDSNRTALIHFDLLQNAVEWPTFLQKLHALARYSTLYRTDGETISGLEVRVVGGATVDLEPYVAAHHASEFGYLYRLLAEQPILRTRSLSSQVHRMPDLLTEQLASHVLARATDGEDEIEALSEISSNELAALEAHSWPGEFPELHRLASRAISLQSWNRAIAEEIPARVFIVWSRHHATQAAELNRLLNAAGIPTWYSPQSMEAGEWWPQISSAIGAVSHVVICISRRMFDIDVEGINRRELGLALERAAGVNWEFLFPVVLDDTRPSDLVGETTSQKRLINVLTPLQWFWVDVEHPGEPFARFLQELRKQMSLLKRAQMRDG